MSSLGFDKDRLREAMGDMSVVELADRLGCGKSSVSMYLNGQREPSKMAVQLIALNLGVNPAWLCGMDVPKYSSAKIISKEKAPTENDERTKKFIELFNKLTPEYQDLILAQLRNCNKAINLSCSSSGIFVNSSLTYVVFELSIIAAPLIKSVLPAGSERIITEKRQSG